MVDLLDAFRIQADVRPITISGGHEAHPAERLGWKVPKKCLVSTMQVLLQGRRLTVAKSLPFTPILVEELLNFQVKVTDAANETFGTCAKGDTMILCSRSLARRGRRSMCRQQCWCVREDFGRS
jgi:hypothetical protein